MIKGLGQLPYEVRLEHLGTFSRRVDLRVVYKIMHEEG